MPKNDFKVGNRVRLENWRDDYWVEVTAIGTRAFLGIPNQLEQMRVFKKYDEGMEVPYGLDLQWKRVNFNFEVKK